MAAFTELRATGRAPRFVPRTALRLVTPPLAMLFVSLAGTGESLAQGAPKTSPAPPTVISAEAGEAAPELTAPPPARPRESGEGPLRAPAKAPPPPAPPVAGPPGNTPADSEPMPPTEHSLDRSPLPKPRPGLADASLIGIFALTTGRTALVRFPGNVVRGVSVGDVIDGWRVSSITNDRMMLTRGSQNRTFVLVGN